jgi:Fe-S-cluster containining protein
MSKPSKKLRNLRKQIDKVKKFKCKEDCFECCTLIQYTPEEQKRMNQCLRKQGRLKPPEGKGKNYCPYLDKNGACSVYHERPIVCRLFGIIKTPMLTCSYFRDFPVQNETPEMWKYMTSSGFVGNRVEAESFLKKIERGDPEALVNLAYTTMKMAIDKVCTDEEAIVKLRYIESRLQQQGDSLVKYYGANIKEFLVDQPRKHGGII